MSVHTEVHFEAEICAHLAAHGWLYAEGDWRRYDRVRALFPDDVLAWVRETQPDAWTALEKQYGAAAGETLLTRLRAQLDQRGTLDVLRRGVDLVGLRASLAVAQFRPALAANAAVLARHAANRLRVVRQVRYSTRNENSIDLVLFLNGVPVAMAELKTDFTQSVEDAVDQYRFDRPPRHGGHPEPLLAFPGGAPVHFAVSEREVRMTTRLDGKETRFLPFNRGDHGGAGNAAPPDGGPRTAYLWEEVWAREGWLEILGRYMVTERDEKKQITGVVFPRYHQLDATRALVAAVRADGVGGRYLVQHSAGSGKTKTIAWAAHLLADLHDVHDGKLFDTVLVVSDRTVIDTQLQEALFDFQRTAGVVATITGEAGSKSGELAAALKAGKKIVVCTIQTFPRALDAVQRLAATEGKRFAVIADEAHSSQAGEAASSLKQALGHAASDPGELAEGGEVSAEDILTARMAARASTDGVTYVAFTATPKAKTLELFGRRPNDLEPAGPGNLPAPFHVYSMRQAIEEGFILDVLQHYTTYALAFKLAHGGREVDEREVERAAAMKGIMGWVRLHPYNVAQKVQVVVEHFRRFVAPLLGGRAKAMVVVASRVEAVRWKLAIERYVRERGYDYGTLVAFSGEVEDAASGAEPFTERSAALNPGLKGRDIRDAFATSEYRILLVANKYQTGFDQPLLCGMYVDRRLAGIQAVQTLSRLNRAHPGKDTTYVVDFVNDADEVLAAFRTYYETATLTGTTDPHAVFDLRAKLDAAGHYDDAEVARAVRAELAPRTTHADLVAAYTPVVDRLLKRYHAAQVASRAADEAGDAAARQRAEATMRALAEFKADAATFVRLYTFLSQVFDYGNTDVEQRALFFRRLVPLLDFGREREGVDLSGVVLTHHVLKDRGRQPMALRDGAAPGLDPLGNAGTGAVQERQRAYLREIIARVNDLFEGELTDQDKLVFVNDALKGKLLESATLRQQAAANTREQFASSPDLGAALTQALIDVHDRFTSMSNQALASEAVRRGLMDVLLRHAGLYEALRQTAPHGG